MTLKSFDSVRGATSFGLHLYSRRTGGLNTIALRNLIRRRQWANPHDHLQCVQKISANVEQAAYNKERVHGAHPHTGSLRARKIRVHLRGHFKASIF